MKKRFGMAMAVFIMSSITVLTGVYAVEEAAKTVEISKAEADLTGDGKDEVILLKGVPYQDETSYLKEIFIKVEASNGKTYSFPLESGARAAMKVIDLNNDGVKDVFATVETGGSGGIVLSYLYSLKDFEKTDLTVPLPLEMQSRFLNGYQAEIKIAATDETYHFDLKDRKKYYKKLGLYTKGRLNEPTELMVNPYNSLEPISLDDGKMGLKGVQRVTGIANADTIAYVTSTWIYGNGQWNLLNVEVSKEKH